MGYAYPLMLDLAGKQVVIIGGGKVGLRKAKGIVDAGGARLTIIAPEIDPSMPPQARRLQERFEPRHLEGAHLVFAATNDPSVNSAIVQECRKRSILVCRADGEGDFATPALWRDGDLLVTVSAGGAPALAARVRDDLAAKVDERWKTLARITQTLRPKLLAKTDLTQEHRAQVFRWLASDEALAILQSEGEEALARRAMSQFASGKE